MNPKVQTIMTKYFLFIFLIVGYISFGQNNNPTKSQLLKVLKKSIRQDTKGKVSINSNPWIICNKDSSFYKSDTLRLYNNINYYYYSNCCDFVDLTFYKKNAFVFVKTQICKEPTTSSAATNKSWFTINFIDNKDNLVLETINQGSVVDQFKVISLDKITNVGQVNNVTNVLTFVRQNRAPSR